MKQLTCEMCGSTDLMKDGGVFVCQTCGCKYSVEEAKKMMIEGSVEVQGTVKIDESDKTAKLLLLARRARAEDNLFDAKRYYDLVLMEKPDDWEANYYASYYTLLDGTIEKLPTNLKNFRNRATTALRMVIENDPSYASDFFKGTTYLYKLVTDHVAARNKEIKDEFMKQLLSGNGGDEVVAWIKREQNELFTLMGYIQDSIMDLHDVMVQCSFSTNNEAFFALLKTCDQAAEVDARNLIEVIDYETYVKKLLRFVELEQTLMPGFNSEALARIKQRAASFTQSKEKGAHILRIVADWENVTIQKRREEYWKAHSKEKANLETERESLKTQINSFIDSLNEHITELNKEIERISGKTEIANLDERIQKLENDKKGLGLFKGKEKKALQEQIDQLTSEKTAIRSRMDAAKKELEAKIAKAKADVQKKVAPMQSRITAINNELTKAR